MSDNPIPVNDITDRERKDFRDVVAGRNLNGAKYSDATRDQQTSITNFVDNFFNVGARTDTLIDLIQKDRVDELSLYQIQILDSLVANDAFATDLIQEYVRLLRHDVAVPFEPIMNRGAELRGYQLFKLIEVYKAWKAKNSDEPEFGSYDYLTNQVNLMSKPGSTKFEPYFEHIATQNKIQNEVLIRPGKFRHDNPPTPIARWQCRIGASTFLVPPTDISVSQQFHTGSLTGGAIRQPNSPKTNLGHSDTHINMTLFFPNHESIWGFAGDVGDLDIFNWDPNPIARHGAPDSDRQNPGSLVPDEIIDRYLSSLRGLITQFKYAPILPIRNEYINRTYGISAVTMNNMTVSTVEGFPFVIAVNLELGKFNYTPFMPMIQDFDQAIHWGKFRQYLGRAAKSLSSRTDQSFLVEEKEETDKPFMPGSVPSTIRSIEGGTTKESESSWVDYDGVPIPTFNKLQDIQDGKNFNFYYPTTTPSRIFAPDTVDFRQPGENDVITRDIWDSVLSGIGIDIVKAPEFNFAKYSTVRPRRTSERNLLTSWLKINNITYSNMNNGNLDAFLEEALRAGSGFITDSDRDFYIKKYTNEWFYHIFDSLLNSDNEIKKIQREREQSGKYKIKEWEVDMEKLWVDWSQCIVQGVSVNLANNFARLQIQLQEDPTFQHIGGGDSIINVRMIVIGEDNLIRFRRMYQHVNGLARLEQANGVLGFLGVKNVLTSLCGIKYVLPSGFEVDTVPNVPHAYDVRMSFVDFDVMQQKREELSSNQQKRLVEAFGKRNPFLRMKQSWGVYNAYPDMPLDIVDEDGEIIGYHDPDWYFRSFITIDKDIYDWQIDPRVSSLLVRFNELNDKISSFNPTGKVGGDISSSYIELENVKKELKSIYENVGSEIVLGYKVENGSVEIVSDITNPSTLPKAEMRQYLGVYGDNNDQAAYIDYFPGGYFILGTENTETEIDTKVIGMSAFKEDLASNNLKEIAPIPGTKSLSEYQNELLDGGYSPNKQYESMMQDFNYRNLRGRMIKAFPTYMLWLIDEGGRFAGVKLFDNFYGLNSVIDFSVMSSEDSMDDTLVLRLSNIYEKLTTPFMEQVIPENDPLYETPVGKWITNVQNRQRNIGSGLFNEIVELNNIRLRPGVRLHLRAGYGSNPNSLQTLFNGTITEVQQGDIMTVIAQSDAVELSAMVNSTDAKGHSGKLDGGAGGFWLSEPRDLMVRLLSMGSSYFKEWLAWGTKGVIFSESRYGIRHFGSIMYEPMTDQEERSSYNVYGAVVSAASAPNGGGGSAEDMMNAIGDYSADLSEINKYTALPTLLNGNMARIASMMWFNSFATRDYELFKRNIYPGNGSGLAQFMGGDLIDGGLLLNQATAFYGTQLTGKESIEFQREKAAYETIQDEIDAALKEIQGASEYNLNKENINKTWDKYRSSVDVTDDELIDLLSEPLRANTDLTQLRKERRGLLDQIINNDLTRALAGFDTGNDYFNFVFNPIRFGLKKLGENTDGFLGGTADILTFMQSFSRPAGALYRLHKSPIGRVLGMSQIMDDDDLPGFDEVSFRAQTYMKTVWDLFKVCAALLPNYIVAVRPFEDRSTVFYGKPHWLYTSGVVPITKGLPDDPSARPRLEDPDGKLADLLDQARKNDFKKLAELGENVRDLKDIMSFNSERDIDPYNVGGDEALNQEVDSVIQRLTDKIRTEYNIDGVEKYIEDIEGFLTEFDLSTLITSDIVEFFEEFFLHKAKDLIKEGITEGRKRAARKWLDKKISTRGNSVSTSSEDAVEKWFKADKNNHDEYDHQLEPFGMGLDEIKNLAKADPITFAFQFGWKFSAVPAWIDPNSGYGTDTVGDLARKMWDDNASLDIEAEGGGRSVADAIDIWRDIRTYYYRGWSGLRDIYDGYFPESSTQDRYQEVLDLFFRFLWQDPYNRAWVIITANRKVDNLGVPLPWADNSTKWNFSKTTEAFEVFITNPISFNSAGVPRSTSARNYMERNYQRGASATNWIGEMFDTASDWIDQNIGQVLSLISDSITGLIASIRISLAQLSNALSQSGEMQKQANILNSVLNDSIYYSMGDPGDLIRMVDNCFERNTEYLTKDGFKKLGETVETVQTVLTSQGWKDAEIKYFGKQKLYKLTLSRGGVTKDIYTTAEHRWFIDSAPLTSQSARKIERKTVDLIPGHGLTSCKLRAGHSARPSPIGIQQGFVFGDGTRDRDQTIAYFIGEKDKALDEFFAMHHRTLIKDEDGVIIGSKVRNLPYHWKNLPPVDESASHLLGWLMGYMAADGCVSKNGTVTLHSNTKENLEFVEYICTTRLGIHTYGLRGSLGKEDGWRKETRSYSITFSKDRIPDGFFIIPEHAKRFNESKKSNLKRWSVVSVEETDRIEDVFCAVVPDVHDFCLRDFILTGNCFTREYGEPVIEIREPFQRVHFVSSFDSILSNNIQENLNGVATVVTAVSDGKYPVTVHLDKGVPPERQVEKTVETGIYWDNAFGSGLFGAFQPLINPLETLRSYTKAAMGSSDQLSARRIALAHLKDSLKDIYGGEILIVGDPDIRPYDLLYIGDVYCQPPETKVRRVSEGSSKTSPTKYEDVDISEIRSGDKVLSIKVGQDGGSAGHIAKGGKSVIENKKLDFEGELIKIETSSGKVSRYTPNHKCIVKMNDAFDGKYITLLHASYIESGMMMKNAEGQWEEITVSREYYSGPVYTLEVDDYETYLADGLFTHNSRMYGMVEVEKVVHHFTPENGFVTAITPNALVTINDPARWTLLSYMWSKFSSYNIRNDVRTRMAVQIDRNVASASKSIESGDVYKYFGTQMNGSMQYTQGNTAIVKDIGSVFSGDGIDDLWNQVAKVDILMGGLKTGLGYAVGNLAWEGWQWVKNNLLDQHGCLPPGKMVMTEGGMRAIETIQVGERVFTHKGRWSEVTYAMVRDVNEPMFKFKVDKLTGMDLEVTGEHPLYVIRADKAKNANQTYKSELEIQNIKPEWIPAKYVRRGDYIVIVGGVKEDCDYAAFDLADYVKPSWIVTDDCVYAKNHPSKKVNRFIEVSEDIMYMIGVYLGDGCLSKEGDDDYRGVDFTFNTNEIQNVNKIKSIFKETFDLEPNKEKNPIGTNTLHLRFGSSAIARWIAKEFGTGFGKKRIPEWVFSSSVEMKASILAGVLESDGCKYIGGHKIQLTNYQLSYDIFRLFVDLGSHPSFNGGSIQQTNKGTGSGPHYIVSVHSGEIPVVIERMISKKGYCDKQKIRKHSFLDINEVTAYRISDIKEYDYSGPVYNLSVEDDESYVAEGLVCHNCYIQFLNKDGQPLDAGISYYEGLAVGSNHTIDLFPNTLGILSPRQNFRDQNGNYRITTDDLLGAIGWTEIETAALYRDTSLYVNQINKDILGLANRDDLNVSDDNIGIIEARILNPTGEELPSGSNLNGVVDGDTIWVQIINGGGIVSNGSYERVRLSMIDTYELRFKNNAYTTFNETLLNDPNDLGFLAYEYLRRRFSIPSERRVVIRVDKNRLRDSTESKRLRGVIFHNAPIGTVPADRLKVLKQIASRQPPVPFDAFMDDGRPYTLNWELVMTGYGNVDMRDSLWDTAWRKNALNTWS